MRRFAIYLLLAPLAVFLFSCPFPNALQTDSSTTYARALAVETDTVRDQAVLLTESGDRLDITAIEEDGTVVKAVEATAVAPISDGASEKGIAGVLKAIIIGTRSDGKPGAWIFSSGKFETFVDEESGKATSCLPESKDKNGTFRGVFGWVYRVMGVSEDGKIIAGYAENKKGFRYAGTTVDPGTTIGVYWRISRHPVKHGFMVSRAQIIGTLDPVKVASAPEKVLRWIDETRRHMAAQLKLFLKGYFNAYLVMVDKNGVHLDIRLNVYTVSGRDQDDQPAIAKINDKGVIDITEVTPPPATPTGLSVGNPTINSLLVSWNAVSGASSYQVYRDLSSGGPFGDLVFDALGVSFTDPGLSSGTTYYYKVRAIGSGGSSAFSDPVSGTTLPGATTVVHVAGYYNAGSGDVAAYWRDDAAGLKSLSTATSSRATSVTVSGGDVYIAGFYRNSAGNTAATWWKNGVQQPDLYSDTSGTYDARANAIAVSGSDVYITGWIDEGTKSASLWKNGALQGLLYSSGISEGLGIAISGADVYVVGYYSLSGLEISCWWKNDVAGRVDLYTANFSRANGIAIYGVDVYAVGYYLPPAGTVVACIWKNGPGGQQDLGTQANATSVAAMGSDVYVVGSYLNAAANTAAALWKNGVKQPDLYSDTSGTFSAQANSIVVNGTDVYAAGWVNEGTQNACYWKNGTRTDLYTGGVSTAGSIVVSN